jgi:hypothetical protein
MNRRQPDHRIMDGRWSWWSSPGGLVWDALRKSCPALWGQCRGHRSVRRPSLKALFEAGSQGNADEQILKTAALICSRVPEKEHKAECECNPMRSVANSGARNHCNAAIPPPSWSVSIFRQCYSAVVEDDVAEVGTIHVSGAVTTGASCRLRRRCESHKRFYPSRTAMESADARTMKPQRESPSVARLGTCPPPRESFIWMDQVKQSCNVDPRHTYSPKSCYVTCRSSWRNRVPLSREWSHEGVSLWLHEASCEVCSHSLL